MQHNADRVGDQATSEQQQPGQNRWNRKLLKNYCAITTNGCSRTTPVIWESEKEGDPRKQPVTSSPIKQELCVAVAPESTVSSSVSGSSTTGMNFVNIKIEPKSPNCNLAQNRDGGYSAISTMEASNSMATSSHHIGTGCRRDINADFKKIDFIKIIPKNSDQPNSSWNCRGATASSSGPRADDHSRIGPGHDEGHARFPAHWFDVCGDDAAAGQQHISFGAPTISPRHDWFLAIPQ